jgi:acetate kinase
VECLEKLEKQTDNSPADPKWFEKMDATQRLYELEMEYYKIKKYGEPSTKYDMVRWLLTKVKNKTLDF